MSQIKLNKASLSLEQKNLKNYNKYLPSLELKRKKLLSERNITDKQVVALKQQENELKNIIQTSLPMVGGRFPLLHGIIKIGSLTIENENIVGVKLPVYKSIQFEIANYSYLNTPHWFDHLIQLVCDTIQIKFHMNVLLTRQQLLNKSIQTVTQRKNLFEKVLIPNALNTIRLIQIFLSDNERAAVVRSKIAKKKRLLS
jgi:V/A-type H+-transporting ATPase subunit D